MNPVDHFIKRTLRCGGYVRFVDDLLLFSDSKKELHAWRERVTEGLHRRYLSLHQGAHPGPVTEGIPFLGFVFFPKRIRLKRRKGVHYRRKLKQLLAAGADEETLVASIQGWLNHSRYGNTTGLQKAILFELGLEDVYYFLRNRPTKRHPVSPQLYVYSAHSHDQKHGARPVDFK